MYDMKNTICPDCGKKFHACPSCGLIYDYEYEYCSIECYKKSLKFKEKKNKIKYLIQEAKNNINDLEDLIIYLYEDIDDEIAIFLADDDIQKEWYCD